MAKYSSLVLILLFSCLTSFASDRKTNIFSIEEEKSIYQELFEKLKLTAHDGLDIAQKTYEVYKKIKKEKEEKIDAHTHRILEIIANKQPSLAHKTTYSEKEWEQIKQLLQNAHEEVLKTVTIQDLDQKKCLHQGLVRAEALLQKKLPANQEVASKVTNKKIEFQTEAFLKQAEKTLNQELGIATNIPNESDDFNFDLFIAGMQLVASELKKMGNEGISISKEIIDAYNKVKEQEEKNTKKYADKLIENIKERETKTGKKILIQNCTLEQWILAKQVLIEEDHLLRKKESEKSLSDDEKLLLKNYNANIVVDKEKIQKARDLKSRLSELQKLSEAGLLKAEQYLKESLNAESTEVSYNDIALLQKEKQKRSAEAMKKNGEIIKDIYKE